MGRHRYSKRKLLEETPHLTIYNVMKNGILEEKNLNIPIFITDTDQSFWITASKNKNDSIYLEIEYSWENEPREIIVDLATMPGTYGGVWYCFLCPMTHKRVTTLYLSETGNFASRKHLPLVYRLSRSHRSKYEDLDRSKNCTLKEKVYRSLGHPLKAKRKAKLAKEYQEIAFEKLLIDLKKINCDMANDLKKMNALNRAC